jgi:hypothetical protein
MADPGGGQLYILAFELGALCLPSLEGAYRAHRHYGFSVRGSGDTNGGGSGGGGDGRGEAVGAAAARSGGSSSNGGSGSGSGSGGRGGGGGGGNSIKEPAPSTPPGKRGPVAPAVEFYAARQAVPSPTVPPAGAARVMLPVPYPLPPQPYGPGDRPWAWDAPPEYYQGKRDTFGRAARTAGGP